MELIWWNKITNASHFLNLIVEKIQNDCSVVIYLPEEVPWYYKMREIVDDELRMSNATSSIKYISEFIEDPGEYLFLNFCKKEKRAHYRPSIGYASFLANSDDIVLNEFIIWISTSTEKEVIEWYNFLENYYKVLRKNKRGCLFIIETKSAIILPEKKRINNLNYSKIIEHYDNYVFNLLVASNLKETELFKQYLAEAVSIMIPNDIELSSLCIKSGREFLKNPLQVIKAIIESESRSDGTRFIVKTTENQLQERLWEAQIKIIFPLIEKQRKMIVKKYKSLIEVLLPINASYGEIFKEVNEVELGTISYLNHEGKVHLNSEDSYKVEKLKYGRNILAHLGTLTQNTIDELFTLE